MKGIVYIQEVCIYDITPDRANLVSETRLQAARRLIFPNSFVLVSHVKGFSTVAIKRTWKRVNARR